ncbi:MAG: dTDP-4-dehydrorhamnose reductase [Thermofilaceae archaeon]
MKILVTGGTGLLGYHLVRAFAAGGHEVHATFHRAQPFSLEGVEWHLLDLEDTLSVRELVERVEPEVIVHAAAYTDVDGCEVDKGLAYRVNYLATLHLTRAALKTGSYLVYVSTDYVFDGERGGYKEGDAPNPVNYYGLSKLLGEVAVASVLPERSLIVRVSGLYGYSPAGKKNFGLLALEKLIRGEPVSAFEDQFTSPTYAPLLAERLVEVAGRGVTGVLHLAGERLSRYDFALRLAELLGVERGLVRAVPMSSVRLVARRPRDSSLDTSRAAALGLALPPLKVCLEHFIRSYREALGRAYAVHL